MVQKNTLSMKQHGIILKQYQKQLMYLYPNPEDAQLVAVQQSPLYSLQYVYPTEAVFPGW